MLTRKFLLNKKFRRTALILIDTNKNRTRSLTEQIATLSFQYQIYTNDLLKILYEFSSILYYNCSKHEDAFSTLRDANVLVNQCTKLIEDCYLRDSDSIKRSILGYNMSNINVDITTQTMKIMIDFCDSCVFHYNFENPECHQNVIIICSEKITKCVMLHMNHREFKFKLKFDPRYRTELLIHEIICKIFEELDGHIMNVISKAFVKLSIIENMHPFIASKCVINEDVVSITCGHSKFGTINMYINAETNMITLLISPLLLGNNFLFE